LSGGTGIVSAEAPGFLNVLSFDFRDYGNVPAQLVDSAMLWGAMRDRRGAFRPEQ